MADQLELPGTGSRPLLLDLFCGAGGAAMGYWRAGWDVLGVDHRPQPRYPFLFVQADAMDYPLAGAAAVHASPPCHDHSPLLARQTSAQGTGWMLAATVDRLARAAIPFVVENVATADLTNCVVLCGSSFGLAVRRHRRFQTNWTVWNPPRCDHDRQGTPMDVTGGGHSTAPRQDGAGGRSVKPRNLAEARAAMGVDWMTRAELNDAIPPAYTEWLGARMIEACAGT